MKRKISLLTIIIMIMTLLVGCGGLYDSSKEGYTAVTNIEQVNFEVSSSWAQAATAITNIRETDEYDGLFVRKTEDTYILFDMSSILIACSRSYYDFQGNESVETLEAHDINNVWLKATDNKLNYDTSKKNGVYKIIADAKADYSVTPTQYATFTGKMASISNGNEEWSIFAGAMSTNLSSSQKKTIEHIVKSFKFNSDAVESSEDTKSTEEVEDTTTEEAPIEEVTDDTEAEAVAEEIPAESGEEEASTDANITEEEAPGESEKDADITEDTVEATEDESAESEKIVAETDETEPAESTEEVGGESEDTAVSDETDTVEETYVKPSTNVGTSTTYKPFNVGDTSDCDVLTSEKKWLRTQITLEEVITGSDALDFIKANGGKKTTPSVGTEFVLVKYSSSMADPTENYIDLKFLGVDAENLRYLGIEYPSKAYDIYSKMYTDDNGTHDIYAYYEVPVGVKEYLLKFGMKALEDSGQFEDLRTANFLITVK